MSNLADALRAAREAAGVSLAGMAARTHYSKALLGLLETGRRRIGPAHVEAYSRALDVSVDSLLGPQRDPLRVAHEWLVGESPGVEARRAGRRVGYALVAELEQRVVRLRHLDDTLGGGDLLPVVRKELAEVRDVVRDAGYTEPVGRRLRVVLGELAQLAGWVASDAGQYAQAEATYLGGVSAAREADDAPLVAQLLSSLSYQMANIGAPRDAALLARTAVRGAADAPPVVTALLWERVAWASARVGDHDGTRRALDAVDEAYAARSPGIAEPEWVYWLDRGEIDVMAGRCLIELGRPRLAEPLLAAALSHYDPGHVREVALYQTWLAEAYAGTGERDAARETLDRAHPAARATASARLQLRLGNVEALLARP